MKSKFIIKGLFALLAIVCISVCVGAYACELPPFQEATHLLAAAPLAASTIASFNVENLKIPVPEFDALKAKYGRLYVLDVEIDTDETYQFIVRRPTRELISAIANSRDDMDKANNIIIKNMIVGGDMDALNDGLVFAKVLQDIGSIIKQGKTFLSKA